MNGPIDSYLAPIERHLAPLPASLQNEWLIEMRQHLDELITEHVENGLTPEQAAALAFAQFGNPARIGRAMFEEWQASLPPESPRAWLVRFALSSVWAALFHIGTEMCLGFGLGLYFFVQAMWGSGLSTNPVFFENVNAVIFQATVFMAGLGLLLGLFGRLPGTQRRGAA